LQPHYPLPATQPELRALARQLEAISAEPGCLHDALFHAWRGAVLMALGEYAAAIEPLERALLMDPDLPAAQLDLALAMANKGDAVAASALFDQLRQRNDLPANVRAGLEKQRVAMAAAATAGDIWHHRLQISSLLGVDSNLNNAPAATELTLTFPQGNVTLPLAATSLPKQGGAVLTTAQWQGLRPSGRSLWVLQGEARLRNGRDPSTHYQQGDVAATWLQAPEAPHQWIARLAYTNLHFGGLSLLQAEKASVQYQWPRLSPASLKAAAGASCRPVGGIELENRRYPASVALDGRYAGAVAALTCSSGQGTAASVLSLQLRAGADRPLDASRPGGTENRTELRALWDTPLPSPWPGVLGPGRLGLQWSSAWQHDSAGYSPLLENNAVRSITRHGLQAEASFALGGGLSLVTNFEASNQQSNLPAFGSRQRSLYLGLRWELM
jgi:tetratricopeptide (TPR) repeat protein